MLLKPGLVLFTQVASLMTAQASMAAEPPAAAAQETPDKDAPAAKEAAKDKAAVETKKEPAKDKPAVETKKEPAKDKSTPPKEGDKEEAPPKAPAHEAPPVHERLYSMTILNKETDDSIIRLCAAAGVTVEFISPALDMITVSFHNLDLHKALDMICHTAGLKYREDSGTLVVGLPMDLDLMFPRTGEKELDAVYRCRHMEADALAQTLAKVLPSKVKITEGPKFLSPSVDSANDPSGATGGDQSVRALSATDTSFKVHDIILSGPAEMVRRGVMLARKFDRPRKQVRIDIRISEIDDNLTQNLGVSWLNGAGSLTMAATENLPASAAATTAPTLVPGLKIGSFSHNPLTVNATLSALEQTGKSRTLSNPTLLLLDGERSFILSGSKILYPKYTGKDQAGQSLYDVAEIKVGIYLQVSVQIGLNNDVVMSLMPQVTSVTSMVPYQGGSYPIVATREAQTTVHAYSGEMVALGGLRSNIESDDRDGIPFLKDIPFLGKLFSTTNKSKTKSDLVIFLTPKIEDDLDHVDKIDVGITE